MKPEKVKALINDIYGVVDRMVVFAALEPQDKGRYVLCRCPQCGQRRAFAYKHARTITCNRANECGYEATLIEFVAGQSKPRAEVFKAAINQLAAMAGIEIKGEGYTPPARQRLVSVGPKPIELKPRPELEKSNCQLKAAMNGIASSYLQRRGIPLDIAESMEVGYAAKGQWPHWWKNGQGRWMKIRQTKMGRLTFPVRDMEGNLINIYGRAIETKDDPCPKKTKHDFLPGPKGVFNQRDLREKSVHIVEGVFDLLAIKAAAKQLGRPKACSGIFGVYGFRWDLVEADNICFCMDNDDAGALWKKVAQEGIERGKRVFYLAPEAYEGHNDLADLWEEKRRVNFHYVEYKGGE